MDFAYTCYNISFTIRNIYIKFIYSSDARLLHIRTCFIKNDFLKHVHSYKKYWKIGYTYMKKYTDHLFLILCQLHHDFSSYTKK